MGQYVKTVVLDQERHLLFNSDALVALEGMLGGESWEKAIDQRGQTRLHAFLLAGLRHEDPNLDRRTIGKVIDAAISSGKNYADIWTMVLDGLRRSGVIPEEEKAPAAANPPDAPSQPVRALGTSAA